MSETPWLRIKRQLARDIASGLYPPGAVLPSEPALSRSLNVSRMTVNRAMRELAAENLVRRVPGVGTFAAEPMARGGLLELRNIADEIRGRGHTHQAEVLRLAAEPATAALAAQFGMAEGAPLFASVLLHSENGVPAQIEHRHVNPAVAPDYLAQDFSSATPNAYLSRVAPVERVEHIVRAEAAEAEAARLLRLSAGAPLLVVLRRTWSAGRLATVTRLDHPGDRFALAGSFTPAALAQLARGIAA